MPTYEDRSENQTMSIENNLNKPKSSTDTEVTNHSPSFASQTNIVSPEVTPSQLKAQSQKQTINGCSKKISCVLTSTSTKILIKNEKA